MKEYQFIYGGQIKLGAIIIVVASIIAGLNSCFSKTDVSMIHQGMGKSVVIAKLGEPDKIYDMPGGALFIYDTAQISFMDTTVLAVSKAMTKEDILGLQSELEAKAKQVSDSLAAEGKRWDAHMDSIRSQANN